MKIKVKDIKAGDQLQAGQSGNVVWEALEDARLTGVPPPRPRVPHVTVHVRYSDGGDGYREWDDPEHELVLVRPE